VISLEAVSSCFPGYLLSADSLEALAQSAFGIIGNHTCEGENFPKKVHTLEQQRRNELFMAVEKFSLVVPTSSGRKYIFAAVDLIFSPSQNEL
jgi:hypothetical protein